MGAGGGGVGLLRDHVAVREHMRYQLFSQQFIERNRGCGYVHRIRVHFVLFEGLERIRTSTTLGVGVGSNTVFLCERTFSCGS